MSGYLPPMYSQGDGSKYQWSNCGCACVTVLIDKATSGALRIPTSRVRAVSGDTSGGLTNNQLIAAAWELTRNTPYPVRLESRIVDRSKVDDLIESGRNFAGTGSCRVTHNTRFETNDYLGVHMISSVDHDPGYYRNDDPGTTHEGYMQWPADLYYRFMEAVAGDCLLLVAPDTEGVPVEIVMKGRIRGTPSVTGTDKGALPPIGRVVPTVKTVNGGPWKRRDGGVSYCWWKLGPGRYMAGERGRIAA